MPLFKRACRLSPEAGSAKFLCLGQILSGEEALDCYDTALDLLSKDLSKAVPEELPYIRREIAAACCSVVELFMTDLCDRGDAQSQCISYIKKAVDVDPEGIETTLCSATYKKTIGDIEGARQECSRCVDFLNILKTNVSDGITDGCEIDLPSVEVRLSLCRTLIDIEETRDAVSILEALVEEDDEDIRVWYLLGCAHFVASDLDAAQDALQIANEVLVSGSWGPEWAAKVEDLEKQVETRVEETESQ